MKGALRFWKEVRFRIVDRAGRECNMMRGFMPGILLVLHLLLAPIAVFAQPINLNEIPSDLVVPKVESDQPAAGKRVWEKLDSYRDWNLAHALYLPIDWREGGRYPVILEYPGNGGFKNGLGDTCDGTVESCRLGYGLTEGQGCLWVSLPFVDPKSKEHAITWWGDADQTTAYCKQVVAHVCARWGGDPQKLILTGFSRGALACSYIGLRDEEIAKFWRALMPHSHYDGVRKWSYADSDPASSLERVSRMGNRPQWISHELSVDAVRAFLQSHGLLGTRIQLQAIPFPNHSADWVLKDIPERQRARAWLKKVLEE